MLSKSGIVETPLGKLAEKGHLATFKACTEGIARSSLGSFVTSSASLASPISFSSANSFLGPCRTFRDFLLLHLDSSSGEVCSEDSEGASLDDSVESSTGAFSVFDPSSDRDWKTWLEELVTSVIG